MLYREVYSIRENYFQDYKYQCVYYKDFNFGILNNIMYVNKPGRKSEKYSDCIMMLDTETSKTKLNEVCENYIVAWSISIRAFHKNICTLYGNKPSECVECLNLIFSYLPGNKNFCYVFNLSYDWVFLRKFFISEFGNPIKQLNTKSHYPIYIEFDNGFILRDALILAQRKLEKWAIDMDVEHKKAVGSWDYDLIRNQNHKFTNDEIHYIENDTLAGVECVDAIMQSINKKIYSMPWTATGIPRDEVKTRGKKNQANAKFKKQLLSYDEQMIMQKVFHGGYTHGNRLYYNETITGDITCYDFASSYPFVMLSEKFPSEKFTKTDNCSIEEILNDTDNAYFFKLILINARLKDYEYPMPCLQFSKCTKIINADLDNGRVLSCDYCEIYLTEIDLQVLNDQYNYDNHICIDVYTSYKKYLPRWFTDYIFDLFQQKTMLKGVDPVLYGVSKGKLNSLYGMTVQRPIPANIMEDYDTGEYIDKKVNEIAEYEKYSNKKGNVLNYQIGVWVTAYAFRNLFRLGACANVWLYSDTDSCYGMDWDIEKLNTYNEQCRKKLSNNNYGPVSHNGKNYWLGCAELDGEYSEFCVLHSKCYCVRSKYDNELHITVAGVPKSGVKVLNDDIKNFKPGCIFPGSITGKKTYTYFFNDHIYIDKNGNEIGDSIDLSPCDYLLSGTHEWNDVKRKEIEVTFYE